MNDLVLNRGQSKAVDQRATQVYGIPAMVLMENAGRGTADTLCQLGIAGPVVICCGKGNNAGDGFVIARHLDLRGLGVKVVMCGDPAALRAEAEQNYQILRRTDVPIEVTLDGDLAPHMVRELQEADWVVDALLGTGASGPPRAPLDMVIHRLNASPAKRLAVDVPSGLDCDTGQVAGVAFRADHTCTFLAPKPGLLIPSARPFVGQLHVLDIGVPRKIVNEILGHR
jgi:NAD(P)H-hydrate epimerase